MAAGVPPQSPVVMVQEAAHDDATIAFLLSQSLLAQQRAEEEAKEAQEVEVLEADCFGSCSAAVHGVFLPHAPCP